MRYSVGYTKKEILRSKAGTIIVDILSKGAAVPLHLHVVFRDMVGVDKQSTSRLRSLWQNVVEEFGLEGWGDDDLDGMRKFLAPGRRDDAPKLTQLGLRIERIDASDLRKSMHGRGCVTGELIPSAALVEMHESTFVVREADAEARLEREAIQAENEHVPSVHVSDDDIPF